MRYRWRAGLLHFVRAIIVTALGASAMLGVLFPDYVKVGSTGRPWAIGFIIICGLIAITGSFYAEFNIDNIDPGILGERNFLKQYVEALKKFVRVSRLLHESTYDERIVLIRENLQNLCNITEGYKNDAKEHRHSFNACLYVVAPRSQLTQRQLITASEFIAKGRNIPERFLVLRKWAFYGDEPIQPGDTTGPKRGEPCVPDGFALPIDEDKDYALFGAPYTFLTGSIYVVGDIRNEKKMKTERGMSDKTVQRNMIGHLHARDSYQSFICMPISNGDGILGVISIQSQIKYFYKDTNSGDQNMLQFLDPFLDIMGTLVYND